MTEEEVKQIQEKRKNKTPRERVDYYLSKLRGKEKKERITRSRKWK